MAEELHIEEVTLSALLNLGKEDRLAIIEGLNEHDFTGCWRELFRMFRKMYLNGEDINIVSAAMNHKAEVEAMHLPMNILELSNLYGRWESMYANHSSQAIFKYNNGEMLVKRLKDDRERGRIRMLAAQLITAADGGKDPEEIYSLMEQTIADRTATGVKRSILTPMDMATLMMEATSERMDAEKRAKDTVYTSYKKLNEYTGGLERGDLIILSAASGSGKSAFAINLVRDTAYTQQKGVLYLNSEMSDKQQARRYAAMLSGVSHSAIRNGLPEEVPDGQPDPWSQIASAAEKFSKSKIYTETIPDLQLSNVVAEVKKAKERYGIDLAIVDYIGRMDTMHMGDLSEWQVMEHAARTLKTLAQSEEIVVIMVAQLSADGQRLAKASAMKNEADLWINLQRFTNQQRLDMCNRGQEVEEIWNTYLEFRKARNVESGKRILLHFHGDTLTFTDDRVKARMYFNLEMAEERQKREAEKNGTPAGVPY